MPDSYSFLVLVFYFFLSSVSCHFLSYQFVLSHFQLTAYNLLSALRKPDNWASTNCTQVSEGPRGLHVFCYTYLDFLDIFLLSSSFLAILQLATTAEYATSELVVYFCITCRSRETTSHSYVLVRPCLEYRFQLRSITTTHVVVRPAGEEV